MLASIASASRISLTFAAAVGVIWTIDSGPRGIEASMRSWAVAVASSRHLRSPGQRTLPSREGHGNLAARADALTHCSASFAAQTPEIDASRARCGAARAAASRPVADRRAARRTSTRRARSRARCRSRAASSSCGSRSAVPDRDDAGRPVLRERHALGARRPQRSPSSATRTCARSPAASPAGSARACRGSSRSRCAPIRRRATRGTRCCPRSASPGSSSCSRRRSLCIGAGGLGSPSSMYLAAAGVGTIGVVDDDVVDASNLQRQILHAHRPRRHAEGRQRRDDAARASTPT